MKRILFILMFISCFLPFITRAEEIIKPEEVIKPIRILLVPGHNDKIWGAQYGNTKEADMNLDLATKIYELLKNDSRFNVQITRDKDGYMKEFSDYFINNREEIISFKSNAQKQNQIKINNGFLIKKRGVVHNTVSKETAVELYGINKWVNENNIDAVLHVHFNDYNRPSIWTIGKYMGFAIYMPDEQMINSTESILFAKSIFKQISKKYATSTYEKEEGGLVSSDSLIALGASGTLNEKVRSVLIEYGYIYRKIFHDPITKPQIYKDMAIFTKNGIVEYFFQE